VRRSHLETNASCKRPALDAILALAGMQVATPPNQLPGLGFTDGLPTTTLDLRGALPNGQAYNEQVQ